jgi:hypothetical protein
MFVVVSMLAWRVCTLLNIEYGRIVRRYKIKQILFVGVVSVPLLAQYSNKCVFWVHREEAQFSCQRRGAVRKQKAGSIKFSKVAMYAWLVRSKKKLVSVITIT